MMLRNGYEILRVAEGGVMIRVYEKSFYFKLNLL